MFEMRIVEEPTIGTGTSPGIELPTPVVPGALPGQSDIRTSLAAAASSAATSNPTATTHPTLGAHPVEEAATIIPGSYTVFGLDPKARSLDRHTFRPVDMYKWIHELMRDPADITFIVADRPMDANIFANLKRASKGAKPNTGARPDAGVKSDADLQREAQYTARLLGIRDLLFIEAVQEHILRTNGRVGEVDDDLAEEGYVGPLFDAEAICALLRGEKFTRKKVRLMSEFLDGSKAFDRTYARLVAIIRQDPILAKMLLDCVPECVALKIFSMSKEKIAAEIDGGALPINENIINLFKYAISETVITLLSGKKYGHRGEKIYDKVATYVFGKYQAALGLQSRKAPEFEYPEVEMTGESHYRTIPLRGDAAEDAFSIAREFEDSDGGGDPYTEMHFQDLELFPIYTRFFKLLRYTEILDPDEKILVRDAEIRKLMKECILAIERTPAGRAALKRTVPQSLEELHTLAVKLREIDPSALCYEPVRDLMAFLMWYLDSAGAYGP